MPRMKAAAAPSVPEPVSIPLGPDGDDGDLLAQLDGDDVEIVVHQVPDGKGNAREAWCFTCGAHDFTWSELLERIRNDPELGPGLYAIRGKRGTQWVGKKVVQIAGRRAAPGALAQAPAAAASNQPDILSAMREMQNQADKRFSELLLMLLAKMPGPSSSGGASITDVISAAKMLTEGKTDPFADLKKLLEVKQLLTGEAPAVDADDAGGDWLSTAIKTFGPAIAATAMQPPSSPPAAPMPAIAPPPPPAPPKPAAVAPVPPPKPKPSPLHIAVTLMLKGARNDSDPDSYALLLLDFLDDQVAGPLLNQPNALELLCQADARVVPFRDWFGQVLEAAREMLAGGDEEEGGLTGPESGTDGADDDARSATIPESAAA